MTAASSIPGQAADATRRTVRAARLLGRDAGFLVFGGAAGERLLVSVIDDGVARVWFRPDGEPRVERTWAVVGSDGDVPPEGRLRTDLSPFAMPKVRVRETPDGVVVQGPGLRLDVRRDPFSITFRDPAGRLYAADHPGLGYRHGPGASVAHYMRRDRRDHYYGGGELSGELDRHHRRFRLEPKDAAGYDARFSDPLYKHIPFYLTLTPDGLASGVFHDNQFPAVLDFGSEINNYWGDYCYFEASGGDLDCFLIAGPTPERVLERYTALTGRMPLPPRWSLGYLASGMAYAEADDPAGAVERFARACRSRRIGCELIHLSSGYSLGPDRLRYTFEWDTRRIPDPRRMVGSLREHGVRTAINVKPALLTSHPAYDHLVESGGLLTEPGRSAPATAPFWGGAAAHVDFTSRAGYEWWLEQVRDRVLDVGAEATWNDNNEYDLADIEAQCAGFGRPLPADGLRPVQSLLMLMASRDAQVGFAPERRPWLISRSGMPGMQRYAQTWSGDNTTSWATLRYNLPMGLGLALSGVANNGHDVGGFGGGPPDAELLVRWVQSGIAHPRFSIHSEADQGGPTEPWMYPEVWPLIRAAIHDRYRLLPYLYTLARESSLTGHPIHRPLVYAYPDDPMATDASFEFLLGPSILVAPVLEPGARHRDVPLPAAHGWYEFDTGARHRGGTQPRVSAPLGRLPLFAREGSLVPLSRVRFETGHEDRSRLIVRVFPPFGEGKAKFALYEDDGETTQYQSGAFTIVNLEMVATSRELELRVRIQEGNRRIALPYESIVWLLPPDESRAIRTRGRALRTSRTQSGWRAITTPLRADGTRESG